MDVGTGDAALPYRLARACPSTYFVGVDANADGLHDTAVRAARKPAKGGVDNLLLVQAQVESLPEELVGVATLVTVYFPWASLMHAVVGTNADGLAGLAALTRPGATFEAVISHDPARDLAVTDMPALTEAFFADALAPRYREVGLEIVEASTLSRDDVRALPTAWAKRLGWGAPRAVWRIRARRC